MGLKSVISVPILLSLSQEPRLPVPIPTLPCSSQLTFPTSHIPLHPTPALRQQTPLRPQPFPGTFLFLCPLSSQVRAAILTHTTSGSGDEPAIFLDPQARPTLPLIL